MHRRVRRLRLAGAREEHAHHGRVLLEDALRTATLHDEGRLIVVRRLHLGRIPLRASATHWSRRLEDSFRQSRSVPVHFDSPAARDAGVVFFENRAEPWFALAERVARGRPAPEWFWPVAVPDWTPRQSPADTLRRCVRALAWQGGLTLTLQLALRLRAAHALDPLLRALHADDLAPVFAQLAAAPATPAAAASAPAFSPDALPPLTSCERDRILEWGADDVRTHWLAALHLVSATPAAALAPAGVLADGLCARIVAQWTRPSPALHFNPPGPAVAPPAHALAPSPPRHPVADAPTGENSSAPATDREFTRAGGLFFLLPLLARAGMPAHLETLPADEAAALPWHILRLALVHARTPEDDPLVATLRELPPTQQPLGRWLIAANRHALRLSGLNLRQIVARPALVSLSAIHIDLFFRPGDAEIRLRRAALDVDPGWVPSLGCVIAFHFNRED